MRRASRGWLFRRLGDLALPVFSLVAIALIGAAIPLVLNRQAITLTWEQPRSKASSERLNIPAPTVEPTATIGRVLPVPAARASASPRPSSSPSPAPTRCSYLLGFEALARQLGRETTGACIEDEYNLDDGNAVQASSRGQFLWIKADNLTSFSDSVNTWYACPGGVEKRLKDQPVPCRGAGPATPSPTAIRR